MYMHCVWIMLTLHTYVPDGLGGRLGLASGEGELRSLTGDVIEPRPPNILVKSLILAFLSFMGSLIAGVGGAFKPFAPDGGLLPSLLFC